MNYYNEIKNRLIENVAYEKVKDYSKERHRVTTYFEIGRLLNEAGKVYGEDIIGKYSKKLVVEVGKKYNRSTLFRMKQFYNIFSDEKVAPLAQQLSWSHYVELLPLKNIDEIKYYIKICREQQIGRDLLREKIKSKEYERLPNATKDKLINNSEIKVEDYIKNPIIIKNNKKYDKFSEKVLQQLILDDIPSFLKELGFGFTFIDYEYKIKIGDDYHSIDLLLYNIRYRCYVVVELKVTDLKKDHIGQVQVYMNYIDKHLKTSYEDNTIGIIIVKRDNKFIMEYCSDNRIFSKEYELV